MYLSSLKSWAGFLFSLFCTFMHCSWMPVRTDMLHNTAYIGQSMFIGKLYIALEKRFSNFQPTSEMNADDHRQNIRRCESPTTTDPYLGVRHHPCFTIIGRARIHLPSVRALLQSRVLRKVLLPSCSKFEIQNIV